MKHTIGIVVLISLFLITTVQITDGLGIGGKDGGSFEGENVSPIETTETPSGNGEGTSEGYYPDEGDNNTGEGEYSGEGDYVSEGDNNTGEGYYRDEGDNTTTEDEENNTSEDEDTSEVADNTSEDADNSTEDEDTTEVEDTSEVEGNNAEDNSDTNEDDRTRDNNVTGARMTSAPEAEVEEDISVPDRRNAENDTSSRMTSAPEAEVEEEISVPSRRNAENDASARIRLPPEEEEEDINLRVKLPPEEEADISARMTPLPEEEEEEEEEEIIVRLALPPAEEEEDQVELDPTSRPVSTPPRPPNVAQSREMAQPSLPASVTFPVDFSTNETSIRTTVFQGDVEATAETMITSDAESISAGLTYQEELSPLVEPSSNRNSDPDVVAFKALAIAAIDTGNASRIATAVVLSFLQNCTCGIISPRQIDEVVDDLIDAFIVDFSNTTELQRIISANANRRLGRRKLQAAGKSPVNSFVCSSCWPRKQCRKLHWC